MSDVDRAIAAIDGYLAEIRAGRRPDREALLRRHPELGNQLRDCLGALEFIEKAMPAAAAQEREGAGGTLGDFRILREVGRGGMGVVYEAEQVSLHRRVALKVLPFAAVLEPKQLQRFRNEAQAAAHLHHTNIVPVYSVGSERGVYYYAMQYIEGESLARAVAEMKGGGGLGPSGAQGRGAGDGPRSPLSSHGSNREPAYLRMAARLGAMAAEALDHAHQSGVIHRDVKPGNLLVDAGGNLWITDFGLARSRGDAGLTVTGEIVGTIRYMSPEQALARRVPVDHRTDIYSLGATLYEVLTLEPAFPGDDPHLVIQDIAFQEPKPPRRLNPAIPPDLETILLKAMAKEPWGRYATAQEMADDLRRFLEDRPVVARRPTPLQRVAKWARRHRTIVRAGLVFLALAMAGLAVGTVALNRARAEAQTNYELAEGRRRETEAHFRTALRAIDEMLGDVGAEELANVPLMDGVRQRLLERAAGFYRDYLAQWGSDPSLLALAAQLHGRMGNLHRLLGQDDEALREYREAIGMLETLVAREPGNDVGRRGLGIQLCDLARLEARLGDVDAAAANAERARVLLEDLVGRLPDEPALADDLAEALEVLARVHKHRGEDERALSTARRAVARERAAVARAKGETSYRVRLAALLLYLSEILASDEESAVHLAEATTILEDLAETSPEAARHRVQLAQAVWGRGIRDGNAGRLDDARSAYGQAISLLERHTREFPHEPQPRHILASICNDQGGLFWRQGKLEDALGWMERAASTQEAITLTWPDLERHRWHLSWMLRNQGNLLDGLHRFGEAEDVLAKSASLLEALAAESVAEPAASEGTKTTDSGAKLVTHAMPDVPDYGAFCGYVYCDLGRACRHDGKYAEAERAFLRAMELGGEDPCRGRHLAWLLAMCPDPAFRDPERAVAILADADRSKWDAETWMTFGVCQYRAGSLDEAAASLEKAIEVRDPPGGEEWFFYAMILWRRGDAEAARALYAQGAAWREKEWPDHEELIRIQAEAAETLEPAEPGR